MPMRVEDYCGVTALKDDRETDKGTKYTIAKWTCPTCRKANSTLYIDGEWCHGDSLTIRFEGGERTVMCGSCWLGDGYMPALQLAAAALACACVDAPKIEPSPAYEAVCAAIKANDRDKPHAIDWEAARRASDPIPSRCP